MNYRNDSFIVLGVLKKGIQKGKEDIQDQNEKWWFIVGPICISTDDVD